MGPYAPLVPAVLMLLAYCLRRFSPSGGWLHSLGGATFIAFCSGLLGAAAEAIAAHGISTSAIVPAVASFVMSFIATANPSKSPTEEPKMILPGEISKFAFLPILFAGSMLLSGCAGTQVVKDVAAQCGVKVTSAVTQTAAVLKTATSADAALAEISQIIGAAASDYEAVYCVISEAVKSLKAQRATTGGAAPPDTQLRAMTADGPSLPSDPTAHGIALGEDLLHERARLLVVTTVGAP